VTTNYSHPMYKCFLMCSIRLTIPLNHVVFLALFFGGCVMRPEISPQKRRWLCEQHCRLPVRFSTWEVKSNGELLVAGACGGGFLVMRWLLATPRRVELFVAFFFAGSAAAYMSIQIVLCRLHAASGVGFPAYALGGRHAANG
jgi:hypothetical protein